MARDETETEFAAKEWNLMLRVSLIAAGAALLGALIGGLSSYIVARQQTHAEANRSRADFLRQQRQTVYAQLIADVDNLEQLVSNVGIDSDDNFTTSECPQLIQVNEAFQKMVGTADTAALISSAKIRKELDKYLAVEGDYSDKAICNVNGVSTHMLIVTMDIDSVDSERPAFLDMAHSDVTG